MKENDGARFSPFHRLFIALLILLGLQNCAQTPKKPTAVHAQLGPDVLYVISTGNVAAELEPCGCKENPLGGMKRRKAFLNQLPHDGLPPVLIDTGNLLFPQEVLSKDSRMAMLPKAQKLMEAYSSMGYSAFVPGPMDFAAGVDELKKISIEHKVPVLAANVETAGTKKQLFAGHRIIERGNYKIGIVGLVSEKSFPKKGVVTVRPAEQALREELNALKNVDLIVVAFHGNRPSAEALTQKFTQVKIWITADLSGSNDPLYSNQSLVILPSMRGQYVSSLAFSLRRVSKAVRWTSDIPYSHEFIALDRRFDAPHETP